MNNDFEHLLSKHGVLKVFNVAKKIKPSYIKSLETKLKKLGKTEEEINDEINRRVVINTQKFIKHNEVPGLHPTDKSHNLDTGITDETRKKILYLANKSTEYCKKHKFSKEFVIFFIQIVLYYMKITNEDMIEFKKKYNIDNNEDGNYLDNEE